jgi:hypothetical protein
VHSEAVLRNESIDGKLIVYPKNHPMYRPKEDEEEELRPKEDEEESTPGVSPAAVLMAIGPVPGPERDLE